MARWHRGWMLLAIIVWAVAGCSTKPPAPPPAAEAPADDEEAEIAKAIAELPEADRPLALAQRFCAVADEGRLGSMGTPVKLEIDGQAVFLCCEGCRGLALADKDKTLARVKALREQSAAAAK